MFQTVLGCARQDRRMCTYTAANKSWECSWQKSKTPSYHTATWWQLVSFRFLGSEYSGWSEKRASWTLSSNLFFGAMLKRQVGERGTSQEEESKHAPGGMYVCMYLSRSLELIASRCCLLSSLGPRSSRWWSVVVGGKLKWWTMERQRPPNTTPVRQRPTYIFEEYFVFTYDFLCCYYT